ncbi:MAG: hypothetical protein AAGA48_13515 [Myxococcota bacterium]
MLIIREEDNVIRLIETDPPQFGTPDAWPEFDRNYWHLTGGPCQWDVLVDMLLQRPSRDRT